MFILTKNTHSAYLPRQFMSPIHCAPQDSVRLFKDIKAKKALGMHWGYVWAFAPPPLNLLIDLSLQNLGFDLGRRV